MTKREKIQRMVANGMTYREVAKKMGIKSASTVAYYAGKEAYLTRKQLIERNKALLSLLDEYKDVCDRAFHEIRILKNFAKKDEMDNLRRIAKKLTT